MSLARAHYHAAPYAIVTATEDMVRHICTHLRALDVAEVAALHTIAPESAPALIMDDWQRHSALAPVFVLMRGDVPLCMFSATPHNELDAAFIWMIGTDQIDARALVRFGKKVVSDYLQRHASLFCLVWSKHRVSLAWLKHLGFTFANTLHVLNSEFVLMVKKREA